MKLTYEHSLNISYVTRFLVVSILSLHTLKWVVSCYLDFNVLPWFSAETTSTSSTIPVAPIVTSSPKMSLTLLITWIHSLNLMLNSGAYCGQIETQKEQWNNLNWGIRENPAWRLLLVGSIENCKVAHCLPVNFTQFEPYPVSLPALWFYHTSKFPPPYSVMILLMVVWSSTYLMCSNPLINY